MGATGTYRTGTPPDVASRSLGMHHHWCCQAWRRLLHRLILSPDPLDRYSPNQECSRYCRRLALSLCRLLLAGMYRW